ncbi:MAG: hypothetical protein M3297_12940 [Thermoproteota archaeon]|nr:hypothetical protein [Thermoproteota archaeon]
MAREPDVISEIDVVEFMNKMKLPNAKYEFMSSSLQGTIHFQTHPITRTNSKNDH